MLQVDVPGSPPLRLEHLVLDLNGTLTDRGELIEGVAGRVKRLAGVLQVHMLTADTFGTARAVADRLGASVSIVRTGAEKAGFVDALGPATVVAIGNGRNDEALLRAAALGMAVIGPEGAAGATLVAADVVFRSIGEALDLLLDERTLVATLRP